MKIEIMMGKPHEFICVGCARLCCAVLCCECCRREAHKADFGAVKHEGNLSVVVFGCILAE